MLRAKSIEDWQREVHALAVEKGWWDEPTTDEAADADLEVRLKLAALTIMHGKLSEDVEAIREGRDEGDEVDPDPADEDFDPWPLIETLSDDQVDILSRIALIHSELSEAAEAVVAGQLERVGGHLGAEQAKPEGMVVELADATIRAMDLCGALELSLEESIRLKHLYNKTRSHRHGGKKA